MYIAGLGHALRRAGQLDLCVAVMASLRQPPQPPDLRSNIAASSRWDAGGGGGGKGNGNAPVLANGKMIINDNIRIDPAVLSSALAGVQVACERERARAYTRSCLCVCTHARACAHLCKHAQMHIFTPSYTHIRSHSLTLAHTQTHSRPHICNMYTYVHIHLHI